MSIVAYLDPGTGSMVAAAIAGAGASVAVAVKAGWHKTLGRKKAAPAAEATPDAAPAQAADATSAPADAETDTPQS